MCVKFKSSFHLVVTVVEKSFSTMQHSPNLPFLLCVVFKLVTLSVDRRTYCLTSVTTIYSRHRRLNGI